MDKKDTAKTFLNTNIDNISSVLPSFLSMFKGLKDRMIYATTL